MQTNLPKKFQIVNENGHFFSVTMTGQPKFTDSKEWGYTYDKARADEVAAILIQQGYDVTVIPFIK